MQYEDIKTHLLERKMTRYQILAVAIGVMVNLMDGFDLLSISFAGPAIDREWEIGATQLGVLFSIGLIGMACGAFGLSWLSDVVGRRTGTKVNLAVMSTGMTIASFAPWPRATRPTSEAQGSVLRSPQAASAPRRAVF